jgi:plastocyanin
VNLTRFHGVFAPNSKHRALVTPAKRGRGHKARERRSAFNFEMVGIAPGAVLTFVDDDSVHATVIDKRKVEFDGETMSLSAAALLIKQRQDYNWRQIQGPAYWTYDGESLDERRRRMEADD